MCRVPGFEKFLNQPDLTAAAGPVLAVDRRKFLALGGYDPIYFPGRIEDLDLGFRGWMAGYRGYFVPESIAYHLGFGTFEPQLGKGRCDQLASRNTLIFMWKNTGRNPALAPFRVAADPVRLCTLARTIELCIRAIGGLVPRASRSRRPGEFSPWGRGIGSRGKRRSFERFEW